MSLTCRWTEPCQTVLSQWTREAGIANYWSDVTYGNGLFVAGSWNHALMTSPDGITWTKRTDRVAAPASPSPMPTACSSRCRITQCDDLA